MKLKYLKLHTPFRGLPAGFEIEFPEIQDTQIIEPFCLVGLNGAGKSNLLELLAELFYFLEAYFPKKNKERKDIANLATISFQISYDKNNLKKKRFINIEKEAQKVPIFLKDTEAFSGLYSVKNGQLTGLTPSETPNFLPNRIIGYSSGMNELLSNPFIKMDFHYFEDYESRVSNKRFDAIEVNRMFFMDYDSNQLVTIANFMIPSLEDDTHHEVLNRELKIKELHGFSIVIRKIRYDGKSIEFPLELNQAIVWLERCATCYTTEDGGKLIKLDYWVNDATKQAFRQYFRTSFELFRYLYLLRLLNIHTFTPDLRGIVQNAKQGVNLSALIPKPEEEKLVFSIKEIMLWKTEVAQPIYYKHLSDGEHQLLHVLGSLILFDTPGTLFLLDEPETHFNPEWRGKFVSLLNQVITEKRDQEIILTTHSPFIISDCKREQVFIFERNDKNEVVYRKPDFNTFGASVNLIIEKVFSKKESIAEMANDLIKAIKEKVKSIEDIDRAKYELTELGESMEKFDAYNYLNKKKKEFESEQ